jgi:response regulator RpfG family c-di-GMP phosphodiesterase
MAVRLHDQANMHHAGPAGSFLDLAEPPRAHSVLVVDDEPAVRELLTLWLQSSGYAVATAASAEDALNQMESEPPAVAVCDIRLPGHDGLWLADRIRHAYPETAVIMATAMQDVEPAVESLRQGVVDYLTKPFGPERLREAVVRGLEWHASARDVRRWRDSVECEVSARRTRLADALVALRIDSDQTLDAMLAIMTIHDREAYAHPHRVAALATRTARAIGLGGDELVALEHGALLHDIGKLAIPQAVILKPAAHTVEERRLVRMHPAVGSALIERVPYLAAAATIVRDAHERVDGLGFPAGSRGDAVGIGARIVCVADAFDTMTRSRSDRDPIPAAEALAELELCSGRQFDRRAVEAFRKSVSVN